MHRLFPPGGGRRGPGGGLVTNLSLNVGNIAGSVLGFFALLSVFIPWLGVIFTVPGMAGEPGATDAKGYTLRSLALEVDHPGVMLLFIIVLALTLLSVASPLLPRWAGIVTSLIGMIMTVVALVYAYGVLSDEIGGMGSFGVLNVFIVPNFGFFMTGTFFFLILVFRLIPFFNRTRRRWGSN